MSVGRDSCCCGVGEPVECSPSCVPVCPFITVIPLSFLIYSQQTLSVFLFPLTYCHSSLQPVSSSQSPLVLRGNLIPVLTVPCLLMVGRCWSPDGALLPRGFLLQPPPPTTQAIACLQRTEGFFQHHSVLLPFVAWGVRGQLLCFCLSLAWAYLTLKTFRKNCSILS